MQTFLPADLLATDKGQEADRILRSCVHCGFCTATCPTFVLTGNELDSPRGRIYLIKEMLEGGEVSEVTQTHLDRCLTCQSCETTCPSDVQYHSLVNIGREHMERQQRRSPWDRLKRFALRKGLGNPVLFQTALTLGRALRPLMPAALQRKVPPREDPGDWPAVQSARKMVILNGCVQNALAPNTNAASARVLARLGIQLTTLEKEGCCGALSYHLNAQEEGLEKARRNIDRLCAELDGGAEAIISSASGCGNFIKDYAHLLAPDEAYASRAQRVVDHCRDLSEVLQGEPLETLQVHSERKLAFQCPCSLQHGQHLDGAVEGILRRLHFNLAPVRDPHLCCGSAGTYSITQPEFARRLRDDKINALEADHPDAIATANIGCQTHLASATDTPVKHWIEYVDEALEQA